MTVIWLHLGFCFYCQTGELIRSFEGHTRSVSGLQIVGRVLVTSCLDKLIRCFDLTVCFSFSVQRSFFLVCYRVAIIVLTNSRFAPSLNIVDERLSLGILSKLRVKIERKFSILFPPQVGAQGYQPSDCC